MKLEFKFGITGIIGFLLLSGLFYWLCPLPSSLAVKVIVLALVEIVFFGMCFVVVTHKSPIRRK